jgi:hypothetical protein
MMIDIKNRNFLSRVGVDSVTTSCGCLDVVSFDDEIAGRETGRIQLEALADPRLETATQSVRVVLDTGQVFERLVEITPVPPFSGWPEHVEAQYGDGVATVTVDPAYADVIRHAVALDSSDAELPIEIDRVSHQIVIRHDEEPPEVLILTFGDSDGPNWSGRFVDRPRSTVDEDTH